MSKEIDWGGAINPVGTIINYLGTIAPDGYLFCDGTEYNIVDYPALANHFETNFGTKNFFGGDGTTTFKVPDLQGEFLRCTGTNSRTNCGSGDNVGVHQDGTIHANIYLNNNGNLNTYFQSESGKDSVANPDFRGPTSTSRTVYNKGSNATTYMNTLWGTSRPTNTSVWYCIKY